MINSKNIKTDKEDEERYIRWTVLEPKIKTINKIKYFASKNRLKYGEVLDILVENLVDEEGNNVET